MKSDKRKGLSSLFNIGWWFGLYFGLNNVADEGTNEVLQSSMPIIPTAPKNSHKDFANFFLKGVNSSEMVFSKTLF